MLLRNHPMLSSIQITGRDNLLLFCGLRSGAEAFCGQGMDPACFSLVFQAGLEVRGDAVIG
jgi:hypothetical protein